MPLLQQLRKSGNSYVVTVPKEVVESNGWEEGQFLSIDLTAVELRPMMSPEVAAAFEEVKKISGPAMRYLADR